VSQTRNFDIGCDDQAIRHHPFDLSPRLIEFVGSIHHSDHDGQITGDMKKSFLVRVASRAISQNAAIRGSAGNIHQAKLLDDRLVQRFAIPLIGFTEINPHQPALPALLFVRLLWFDLRMFLDHGFHDGGVLNFDQTVGQHVV